MKNKIEKSATEAMAEKWFKKNGYEFSIVKQYYSKTIYEITKENITMKFELPFAVASINNYMKIVDLMFNQRKEIDELKKQLNNK